MTSEEARALFDEAVDGDLGAERAREFDTALGSDPGLREEYGRYRQLLSATAALDKAPAVDLLAQVQAELRTRSGGRFYRDRFAEHAGRRSTLTWVMAGCTLLLLLVVMWFALDAGHVVPADGARLAQ